MAASESQQSTKGSESAEGGSGLVETPRPRKVARIGVVDSISGRKTVRIVVNSLKPHPLYGKYVQRRTKMLVHDAAEQARVGDTVEVTLSRPISKTKRWRLVRVVRAAQQPADLASPDNSG